jgi:superfamily II DNA or RNA helicase
MEGLEALVAAVRSACSARSWSLGVELCRGDAVAVEAEDDGAVTLRVKSPGRTVAPRITIYPQDEEWDCDCGSSAAACEHAAAAALALRRADKEGAALPVAGAHAGRVGYRLRPEGARLVIDRVIVSPDGGEMPLAGRVRPLADERDVELAKHDLSIDALLAQKRLRSLPLDVVRTMWPLFAEARDVRFGDEPVRVAAEPLAPHAVVDARGQGCVVRLEAPPDFERAAMPGIGYCRGAVLRILDMTEAAGMSFERLPSETLYPEGRLAELAGQVLPALRARTEVDVRAQRLRPAPPGVTPRAVVEVAQRGAALVVAGRIVYGDPPCARLDGERFVSLAATEVERDRRAERRLVRELESLGIEPGQRFELEGAAAWTMARRLKSFDGEVQGSAHRTMYPDEPLDVDVAMSADDVEVRFERGGAKADAEAVLAAYARGDEVVPLLGGGWGKLPVGWLERHGQRLSDLLAAREGGKLPRAARPALAALARELGEPPPPELAGLERLFDGGALPVSTLPADLSAELRGYQRAGVDWLSFLRDAGLGALLADDMGLGKTLEVLCALRGRALVVCPLSVVHGWQNEIARFRPGLRVAVYHGEGRAIDRNADVTLTTYGLLRSDIEVLEQERWDVAVLDEAQNVKNPASAVARASYRLEARFRVALTGTPIENRLEELWSLLHFACPGLLGGLAAFRERYDGPIASGDASALVRMRARIRPFVLRRTKSEVLRELPPRSEAVLFCELDEQERVLYDALLHATREDVVARLERGGSVLEALEALLRLRQAACDPALVPGQASLATDEDGKPRASSKVRRLVESLEEAAADGHRALVFSQWTSLLDRIEPQLDAAGIAHDRLDGSTRDRAGVVARFQGGSVPVLLVSLKAGGTGLNLTAADHVFLVDPWWNPAVEDQAADRAHRIGQERPVLVYRLVATGTVEERILALQANKRALAEAALSGTGAAARLTRADLMELLQD